MLHPQRGYECNIIKPSLDQLVCLAVLYNTSLDCIMGLEDRNPVYLNGLTKSQQQTVMDLVDWLKVEFLNKLQL